MKPYESDYPIAANIAAPHRLARRTSRLSIVVSGCPVPGQNGKPGRGGNRIRGTGEGNLKLQTHPTVSAVIRDRLWSDCPVGSETGGDSETLGVERRPDDLGVWVSDDQHPDARSSASRGGTSALLASVGQAVQLEHRRALRAMS